jgi:hypothetical protein
LVAVKISPLSFVTGLENRRPNGRYGGCDASKQPTLRDIMLLLE